MRQKFRSAIARASWFHVLACILGIVGAPASASAMSFELTALPGEACAPNCPLVIAASGEIALDSDERFVRFVQLQVVGQRVTSVVLMSSPGGNLVGSIRLGLVMRQLGFSIMVGQARAGRFLTARCYSACAYTLAGGRRRIVPEGSEVGVHKAWTNQRRQRDIVGSGTIDARISVEGFSPFLSRYLQSMGVSNQLVALADATPSSDIRVLSREELSRLRVITPKETGGKRRRRS